MFVTMMTYRFHSVSEMGLLENLFQFLFATMVTLVHSSRQQIQFQIQLMYPRLQQTKLDRQLCLPVLSVSHEFHSYNTLYIIK